MGRRQKRKKLAESQSSASAAGTAGGALSIRAQYDAGRNGRRLAGWSPPSTGPNRAINNPQVIRNRARDAARNEWSAESTIRNLVVDIVGTGITCRLKTKKKGLKQKLDALWNESIKVSDADGILHFYGQQELVARTWEAGGECFGRFRPRLLSDGLPVPLQVQLIESDQCPIFDAESWPDLPPGNKIRQGIELDRIGRRAAYWMYKEHPGDFNLQNISATMLVRIPASEIIHVFKPLRPGQLRGVTKLASTLVKMKTVGDFDDAVTEKAKLQNLYVGVITKPPAAPGSENTDPLTGKKIEYASNGEAMVPMEPGAMIELAEGEEITFSSPPSTGAGYADFLRQQNLSISGGNGVPYEIMTGDILNVSDRTLRVIIQQYRRHIEQDQWNVIIPMFCQRVRDAWVDAAVIAGLINIRDAAAAKDVEWSPQAWAYIHPVQDVQGKVAEMDAGITSRSAVIASRGYDPEEVDAERAADQQREKDLGIAPPPPKIKPAKQSSPMASMAVESEEEF